MTFNGINISIPNARSLVLGVFFLSCLVTFSQTTNLIYVGKTDSDRLKIETVFYGDEQLTSREIIQVVKLAQKCGITNPEVVSFFQFLPAGGKGIRVKSKETHDGRNTYFSSIEIYKAGWSDIETNSKSRFMGDFSAEKDGAINTVFRDYTSTNGTVFQVDIGKGVEFSVADKLVETYLANNLLPKKPNSKNIVKLTSIGLENIQNAKPKNIRKNDSEKCYEMEFDNYPTTVVKLKIENGNVVIMQTYEYVI